MAAIKCQYSVEIVVPRKLSQGFECFEEFKNSSLIEVFIEACGNFGALSDAVIKSENHRSFEQGDATP